MNRVRIYGTDSPFGAWLRAQEARLPSRGDLICGISLLDIDWLILRYLTAVDGVGSRDIQAIFHVETKTYNGEPNPSQLDTLWKDNLGHKRSYYRAGKALIRNFGWFILSMSGTRPDDSEFMRWGIIEDEAGRAIVRWHSIDCGMLLKLLRLDVHPKTFVPEPFRRHHKTQKLHERMKTPLGFEMDYEIIHRS